MKKIILLSVLSVFLFASKSEAQNYGFVTSFGVTQQWDIPYDVYYTVDNQYLGYNWVHAQRFYRNGGLFFEVVLQRGDVFVRVQMDRIGRVYNRNVSYNYPLHDHICSDFCGYHSNFYISNRNVCTGHNHYGHNHVQYRTVVINNGHNHYPKGNAYGYYNKKSKKVKPVYSPAISRRSGAVVVSNRSKSRLNLDKGRNDGQGSYGKGNSGKDKGGNGSGYGRGDSGNDKEKGNRGNNGNAYGRGKDNGKGNGLGRGKGDGNQYSQDERSRRGSGGNNSSSSSRATYRSRTGN